MNWKLSLSPWLHQWLAINSSCKHLHIMSGRRSGKTATATMCILLRALAQRGLYWWLSPTYDQVQVAVEEMIRVMHGMPGVSWSAKRQCFTLPNGSRIVYKSAQGEKSLRGWALDGLVVDEAGEIKRHVWVAALMPALRDRDGWVILAGTPHGFNWFSVWREDEARKDPKWQIFSFPTWANPSPNTTREACEALRSQMQEHHWRQEHLGRPTSSEFAHWPAEYFGNIFCKSLPAQFMRSAVGVDLSLGKAKSDWQGVVFLGVDTQQHQWLECFAMRTSISNVLAKVKQICDERKVSLLFVDYSGQQGMMDENFQALWPHGVNAPEIIGVKEHVLKDIRISRLGTPLSQHHVHVLDNDGGREWHREALDWPDAANDDLLDAHELAFRGLIEHRSGPTPSRRVVVKR